MVLQLSMSIFIIVTGFPTQINKNKISKFTQRYSKHAHLINFQTEATNLSHYDWCIKLNDISGNDADDTTDLGFPAYTNIITTQCDTRNKFNGDKSAYGYSRSSVEQSSIARHCCHSLSIFCCRLKSHLFSLSYPAFWLFSHSVSYTHLTLPTKRIV